MPGTFAALDQNLPRFTGEESLERRVQLLQDYQYQLLEQLRYILSHLDMRCFSQAALKEWTGMITEPIYGKIADAEGNITRLEVTAKGIQTQVSDNAGNISALQQTATNLSSRISSAQGDISTLQQTATSLSSRISNAQGDISTLQQTAVSLSSQISNAQGEISTLQQTAVSLSSQISNAQGDISSLWQTVDGFYLSVSNGESSSTLTLMNGRTELSSAEIVLKGAVTFEDLSGEGKSIINGANIVSGVITASYVGVDGCFALYNWGQLYGYMGCGYGYDGNSTTYGAMLSSANGRNYLLAANSGVRMEDADGGAIWVTGGTCCCSQDMMTYSDRRLKEDIDHDLSCYKAFVRALRPCRFLMAANPAEGYHTGFVAQEVETALDAANLSMMDFAGLGGLRLPDKTRGYALRHSEFIALNTYMIQELDRAAQELERRVAALEENARN